MSAESLEDLVLRWANNNIERAHRWYVELQDNNINDIRALDYIAREGHFWNNFVIRIALKDHRLATVLNEWKANKTPLPMLPLIQCATSEIIQSRSTVLIQPINYPAVPIRLLHTGKRHRIRNGVRPLNTVKGHKPLQGKKLYHINQ